jgi:hypothetical protein
VPVVALPGNIRFRAFQTGPESTFGTAVPATRRHPWRFAPAIDPHWTDPDVDTGTLGHALPPYRTAIDVTGLATGKLAFDDIPTLMAALWKPITPSPAGAAITWTALPAETSQDNFQPFSGEWGDEIAGDQFGLTSGVLEKLALAFPQDLSPVDITADWRFAAASYPHALTGGLSVDPAPVWVYAADSQLYLDSTAGGIGGTALANTLHGVTVTISQALDVKRFMNGSNTRFQAQGYGRGLRTTEAAFTFAKSTSALAAAADWLNANAQKRYLALKTISPTLIPTTAVPYSSELRFAGYWYTRAEATYQQSNSAISLVCRSVYDPTLTYNTWWQAICARAAL